jgi:hypothetical protein
LDRRGSSTPKPLASLFSRNQRGVLFIGLANADLQMTNEELELKLALDVLLDDMSHALATLRRRQNLVADLHDPEYVMALDRYDRARNRWLVVLDDLRVRLSTHA